MERDERKDSGEYYPEGRQAQGGGGSGGGGDVTPKVPVTPVDELPERYRESDMRAKINQLARIISGGIAALAAMVATAQVTVQGARKGALWNDDFVVTNVTAELGGYATTNALAAAADAVEATAEGKLAAATNDLAGTMGGVIVSATNSLAASVGHDIAAATNAMGAATDAKLEGYARKTWVEGQGYVKGSELSGYATESWVGSQGYATRAWTETRGYLTETNLAPYATREWTEGRGYATGTNLAEQSTSIKAWVQGQGYLKGTDLGGYATESWVEGRNYATRTELGNVQAGIGPTVRAEVEEAVRDVVQERDVALRLEDMSDVPGQTNGWRWGSWIDGSGGKHNVDGVWDETGTNIVGLTTNETTLVEQGTMYDYVGNEIYVATNALAGQIAEIIPPGMTTNDVCNIVTNEAEGTFGEWQYPTANGVEYVEDSSMCSDTNRLYYGVLWYDPPYSDGSWTGMLAIYKYVFMYEEYWEWQPDEFLEFSVAGTAADLSIELSWPDYLGTFTITRTYTPGENALGLARLSDLPIVETNAINAAKEYTDSKEYTVVEKPTVYKYYVTTNAEITAGGEGGQPITNVFPGMAFDLYETNSVYFIDDTVPTLKFFAPSRRQAYWPNQVTAVEIGDPMQVLRTYFFQADGNIAINSPTNLRFMSTLDRNAPYDQGRAMSLQDYLDAFNPVLVPETIRLFQTNRSDYSVGSVTAHASISVERANGSKAFEVTPEGANMMDAMTVAQTGVEVTGDMAVSNLAVRGSLRFASWDDVGVQEWNRVVSLSNYVYQVCDPLLKYTFGDMVDCSRHYVEWYDEIRNGSGIFRIPVYNKYTYMYDAAVMDAPRNIHGIQHQHTVTNITVVLPRPDGGLVGSNYLPNEIRSYLDTKFVFDLGGISHAITFDIGSCNFTNRTNRWGIEGEWTTIYSDVEPTNIVQQVVHTETTVYYDWIEDPESGEWVEDLDNPQEITTEWYDEYSMDMVWRLEPYKAYEFHLQQVGPKAMRLNWKRLYKTNPHSGN